MSELLAVIFGTWTYCGVATLFAYRYRDELFDWFIHELGMAFDREHERVVKEAGECVGR